MVERRLTQQVERRTRAAGSDQVRHGDLPGGSSFARIVRCLAAARRSERGWPYLYGGGGGWPVENVFTTRPRLSDRRRHSPLSGTRMTAFENSLTGQVPQPAPPP